MRWMEKYVGLPFKDFGRDFRGVDCWGLVRLVLARECGIIVPSYGEISATDLIRVTSTIKTNANIEPWREVKRNELQAYDVALMRGRPMHVGIMTTAKLMLHVEKMTATVLLPLTHPSIAGRLLGFRRHCQL
jgi:cell wall-associated NlpC family hydrolase